MARVVPEALAPLFPAFSPMVVAAPLVHVMVIDPVLSSGVDALATTGSYPPKLIAVVLMVQLLDTLAVTVKVDVADPAIAGGPSSRTTTDAMTKVTRAARRRMGIHLSSPGLSLRAARMSGQPIRVIR